MSGRVYRLFVEGHEECYIGSTKSEVHERLYYHRADFKKRTKITSAQLFMLGDVKIELLEDSIADDMLLSRERHWLLQYPMAVNRQLPGRTREEYNEYVSKQKVSCGICGAQVSRHCLIKHQRRKICLGFTG